MLSMMKKSSGASSSARSISLRASGRRVFALGEGIAERVVGGRMVGTHLDQLAQVRLEDVEAIELLGGERVVVQQLGLLGILLQRIGEKLESVLDRQSVVE